MLWACIIWSSHAHGTRTEVCFGHGCSGHRMHWEHERNYALGMDAAVSACSWNTNGIMLWALMIWSSHALGTRTELCPTELTITPPPSPPNPGRDNDEKAQLAPRQPSSTWPSCHAGHAFQGLNIKHPTNARILSWRETRTFPSRQQHARRKSERSGGFRTCQNHHAGQGFQHVREMTTRSVTMRGAVSPPTTTPITEPDRLNFPTHKRIFGWFSTARTTTT